MGFFRKRQPSQAETLKAIFAQKAPSDGNYAVAYALLHLANVNAARPVKNNYSGGSIPFLGWMRLTQ